VRETLQRLLWLPYNESSTLSVIYIYTGTPYCVLRAYTHKKHGATEPKNTQQNTPTGSEATVVVVAPLDCIFYQNYYHNRFQNVIRTNCHYRNCFKTAATTATTGSIPILLIVAGGRTTQQHNGLSVGCGQLSSWSRRRGWIARCTVRVVG
jgi:hypothetical protein